MAVGGYGAYGQQMGYQRPVGAPMMPPGGTGVVGTGSGYTGGYSHSRPDTSNGPVDPLDAYMASVHRELDRSAKGKKKKERVGDVASARETFGPKALQKLRPGGFEGRDTDALLEDKLLR